MTYDNAYEILANVREDLNEYSTAYMEATDTSCIFSNAQLMRYINNAQNILYGLLLRRMPEAFLKSVTAAFSDSVYTLPPDFGRLSILKDDNGNQVFRINPSQIHLASADGNKRFYYRKSNTYVLDKDSYSPSYELWYYWRCRELHQGEASAGAALSITFATTAKKIVDYYNGLMLENITQDWVDTIDDYTVARVATISETAAANDFYGTVSDLQEEFHHLIAPLATIITKSRSPVSQEKPTENERIDFRDMLVEALAGYMGGSWDETPEDIFLDFEPLTPVNIGIM